jgi:hypothetical protein
MEEIIDTAALLRVYLEIAMRLSQVAWCYLGLQHIHTTLNKCSKVGAF